MMCDLPSPFPMRGGVPCRVPCRHPRGAGKLPSSFARVRGFRFTNGGVVARLRGRRGRRSRTGFPPSELRAPSPRGVARFGVYACQICTQRGSGSHLRWRLLLRPGTRAYVPPMRRGVASTGPGRATGGWWVVHLRGSASRVWEGGGWTGFGRPPKPEGSLPTHPVRLFRENKEKFSCGFSLD